MKRFLFALSCLATISSHAQTADEVIQKYSAALGGLEAFNKVTDFKNSKTNSAVELFIGSTIFTAPKLLFDL